MSGLDSIALAVAHLERMKETEKGPLPKQVVKDFNLRPDPTGAIIPQGMVLTSESRLVSADSPTNVVAGTDAEGSEISPRGASDFPAAAAGPMKQPHVTPWPVTHDYSGAAAYKDSDVDDQAQISQALPPIPTGYSNVDGTEEMFAALPAPPPPDEVIDMPQKEDVLCGRGGETNHHPGNVKYRQLVKNYQPLYMASKRRSKPRIALRIVVSVRQQGGRFLKKDPKTQTWRDVGNTKAREKTSQALREGAPELRVEAAEKKKTKKEAPSTSQDAPESNKPVATSSTGTGRGYNAPYPDPSAAYMHFLSHHPTLPHPRAYYYPGVYPGHPSMVPVAAHAHGIHERRNESAGLKRRRSSTSEAAHVVSHSSSSDASGSEAEVSDKGSALPRKGGPRLKLLKRRLAQGGDP